MSLFDFEMQSEEITAIPPAEEEDEIHNLSDTWVFWYLIPNRSGQVNDWNEYLHPLHSFSTAEDFIRLLNSIEHPKKLLRGCRYYVFRSNSKPLWEHPAAVGGHFVSVEIAKDPERDSDIERKWIELVQSISEDEYPGGQTILGIEYNSRPTSWKISIWTSAECDCVDQIKTRVETDFDLNYEVTISEISPD
ncbi:Eukaryotic initiation factor 4E family protein [Tritrichomonas foetus]|uniref:Eukaryotic initiation factor 4E family protein n=1 Tax=Tritrichomonas foetus TaxID=1144522 RepID=A0A1J4KBP6_9EUKA|nr:Eukaryotic initiation factor 4E family protein [Tritrichomonas foetus]|eukprot:OHT06901.1 Eukaryotic initiation factor 4E family protein [Tritrichomonas foetus]